MFYCEECQKRSGWPVSIAKSFGRCEVCKKQSECNDVPSWRLP